MPLQSIEFSEENIKKRIVRIYSELSDRIMEFMRINREDFAFQSDLPCAMDGDYEDNKVIGKTTLSIESGQITVNVFYKKITSTLKLIFINFQNYEIADKVCDLYIEFILAHEFAHVQQIMQDKVGFVNVKEREKGIPEASKSYEIEADCRAKNYMNEKYHQIGNVIGDIGREIHLNSNSYRVRELIKELI